MVKVTSLGTMFMAPGFTCRIPTVHTSDPSGSDRPIRSISLHHAGRGYQRVGPTVHGGSPCVVGHTEHLDSLVARPSDSLHHADGLGLLFQPTALLYVQLNKGLHFTFAKDYLIRRSRCLDTF